MEKRVSSFEDLVESRFQKGINTNKEAVNAFVRGAELAEKGENVRSAFKEHQTQIDMNGSGNKENIQEDDKDIEL